MSASAKSSMGSKKGGGTSVSGGGGRKSLGGGGGARGSMASQGKRGSMGRRGSRKGGSKNASVSALEQQQIDQRKFKEQQQALRKNKAYQQLKREMETKQRNKAKAVAEAPEEKPQEVIYVDRDRAAAVQLGAKDIRKDLRKKRHLDRLENATTELDDEVSFATFLAQGEHELKSGDATRALRYFNKASALGCTDELLFTLRCQCHLKLGHFSDARQDALKVLEVDPYVTKGLIVMAESEYHLGNFERALMYFHRANFVRPGYGGVPQGINKSRDAIENSLSRQNGFSFTAWEDVINAMIEDGTFGMDEETIKMKKLGFVTALGGPVKEEDDASGNSGKDRGNDADDESDDPTEGFDDGRKKNRKYRDEDRMFVNMGVKGPMMDLVQPALTKDNVVLGMLKKFDKCREDDTNKERLLELRKKRKMSLVREVRAANKQLLGKLYADQIYLEKLLVNPQLNNSGYIEGIDVVQKKIKQRAQEGLDFLSARKDFWQQQKPIYAMRNELAAKMSAKRKDQRKKKAKQAAFASVKITMVKYENEQ